MYVLKMYLLYKECVDPVRLEMAVLVFVFFVYCISPSLSNHRLSEHL